MANVSVYNIEGKEVGSIELNDAVFGVEVNEHLVQDVYKRQRLLLFLLRRSSFQSFQCQYFLWCLLHLQLQFFILTDAVLSFFRMLIRGCRDSRFLICQLCLRIRQR